MANLDIVNNLKLIGDYHTHTIYSSSKIYKHGKGRIIENAKRASELGISEIAITDHGPAHRFYGIKISELPKIRKDIEEANKIIKDIKIHLSVEANIIDTPRGIDIEEKDIDEFDYLTAGYHLGCESGQTIKNIISYGRCMPRGRYERLRSNNTNMTIRAIYQNDIKVLTHPFDKAPFHKDEILKACEENHTLIEINNRHNNLTVDDIYEIAKYNIKFIISSDAHRPREVGKCELAIEKVLKSGLEIGRVVNLERRS